MKTLKSILMTVLLMTQISGPAWAGVTDYRVFNGHDDVTYTFTKYMQWGWLEALDAVGLQRAGYYHCSPADFIENSFIPSYWTYPSSYFGSAGVDYPVVSVYSGPTSTIWDCSRNEFRVVLGMRYPWSGSNAVTDLQMYIGEGPYDLPNDQHPGFCRYFFVLGSNDSVALGPAMSKQGCPTCSRVDLFNPLNPMHVDPFKVWSPVMSPGLRMILGLSGGQYYGSSDQAMWKKFADYWKSGNSIARSFAQAALDADSRHIPVVIAQASSGERASQMIQSERSFTSDRPGTGAFVWNCWYNEPLNSFDGYYVWRCSGYASVRVQAVESEPSGRPRRRSRGPPVEGPAHPGVRRQPFCRKRGRADDVRQERQPTTALGRPRHGQPVLL